MRNYVVEMMCLKGERSLRCPTCEIEPTRERKQKRKWGLQINVHKTTASYIHPSQECPSFWQMYPFFLSQGKSFQRLTWLISRQCSPPLLLSGWFLYQSSTERRCLEWSQIHVPSWLLSVAPIQKLLTTVSLCGTRTRFIYSKETWSVISVKKPPRFWQNFFASSHVHPFSPFSVTTL